MIHTESETASNGEARIREAEYIKDPVKAHLDKDFWNQIVFSEDTEFSSPSAAAVIHGGHANGLAAWKNAKGQTLKDMESA